MIVIPLHCSTTSFRLDSLAIASQHYSFNLCLGEIDADSCSRELLPFQLEPGPNEGTQALCPGPAGLHLKKVGMVRLFSTHREDANVWRRRMKPV